MNILEMYILGFFASFFILTFLILIGMAVSDQPNPDTIGRLLPFYWFISLLSWATVVLIVLVMFWPEPTKMAIDYIDRKIM